MTCRTQRKWGSDSNREKNNDLPDDRRSETLSQTMVIEKPQEVRVRPHDFAGSWFSITILECDFSNRPLGDGFREEKTRWNRASGRVRCFFLRYYRNPKLSAESSLSMSCWHVFCTTAQYVASRPASHEFPSFLV